MKPRTISSSTNLIPAAFVLAAAAMSTGRPSEARAEGTAQLNTTQALRGGTTLYVDIVDATAETIDWTGVGTLEVRSPSGTLVATLSSGGTTGDLSGHGNGAYELLVNSNQIVYDTWDVTVGSATDGGGRLFSYDWRFNAGAFSESRATQASFYAVVPGGGAGQTSVIELQLNGLAGYVYDINANRIGVDGVDAGRSVSMSGAGVTPEFPIYLQPPSASTYSASSPDIFDFSFVGGSSVSADGAAMTPCDQVVPGGSIGYFQFTTTTEGTYHLQCDIDGDGAFETVGDDDLLLVGTTSNGLNSVEWDGMVNGEAVGGGQYECVVSINVGEFHYVGADIETSYPGMRLYEVHADETRSPLTMYWADQAVQSNAQQMPNGAYGLESSGANGIFSDAYNVAAVANVNARSWGNWNSGGKGNQAYLDTYTWLASAESTTATVSAVDHTVDSDGDGAGDYEESCVFGTDPTNPDSDGDGVSDGEQYGGGSSSGGGNGLESNGELASRLARRAIVRSRVTPQPTATFRAAPELQRLAPSAETLGVSAVDATPWDLPELTNATDVFGRDYYDEDGKRVGGILLVRTDGAIYDHSKVICDRSQGGVISDLAMSRVAGHDIVRANVMRADTTTRDRMATFSIHEDHTAGSAGLFSYWLSTEYPDPQPQQGVTRVQVWSSVPGGELALARQVIDNAGELHGALSKPGSEALFDDEDVAELGTTTPLRTGHLPAFFIRRGEALGGTLALEVVATKPTAGTEPMLRVIGLRVDGRTEDSFEVPLTDASFTGEVEVDVSDYLDVTVELVRNGEVEDRVWLSDGAWASYDDSLWGGRTVADFSRSDCTARDGAGDLALRGCGTIEATVEDTLGFAGVARHLARPLALAPFRSMSFHRDSSAPLDVCLQADDGAHFCASVASGSGWVALPLTDLTDDTGSPLSGAVQASLVTWSSAEAGAVSLEVSGLALSEAEVASPVTDPAASDEPTGDRGGCACRATNDARGGHWWTLLGLLIGGVHRRSTRRRRATTR